MASDDKLDKELGQLDEEIDAKVDSLFVEDDDRVQQATGSADEDPLKGLKEHFLALEWEIGEETLEKISQEIGALRPRYSEGPLDTLLGWMEQVAESIRAQGSELDQKVMGLFHRIKDGFLRIAEDPTQDAAPVLDPLREEMERLYGPTEEEEPTITLETAAGEEELLFEELDRIMDETPEPEEELVLDDSVLELHEESEKRPAALEETVEEEKIEFPREVEVEDTAVESAEEFAWEGAPEEKVFAESEAEEVSVLAAEETVEEEKIEFPREVEVGDTAVESDEEFAREAAPEEKVFAESEAEEVSAPAATEAGVNDLERIRISLAECGKKLEGLIESFRGADGPMSMTALLENMEQRMQSFAESMQGVIASLQQQIKALDGIDMVARPSQPEAVAKPESNLEQILLVSVASRIFGIPLASVLGIFRVPGHAVSHVVKMAEIRLRGKAVSLIPLWRKLGLGKDLYTFPTEEKCVLLVRCGSGELALLVDRVLAKEELPLKPLKGKEHALFKGVVTAEKWAFVVELENL
jgi:chemotaxis signal transduction protein